MPEKPPSMESSPEHIPSEGEVLELFQKLAQGREFKEVRRKEESGSLASLEIELVEVDEKNRTIVYAYTRKTPRLPGSKSTVDCYVTEDDDPMPYCVTVAEHDGSNWVAVESEFHDSLFTVKNESSAMTEETEKVRIESERQKVVELLCLDADATWEDIEKNFDPALVLVCKAEGHLGGYYLQTPELAEEYKKAVEKSKSQKESLSCALQVEKMEDLLLQYEDQALLDGLFAITDRAEALNHPVRIQAKKDIDAVTKIFSFAKNYTNLQEEQATALQKRIRQLRLALGVINSDTGTVDHTRT
jgi:hypothetical protein